VADRYDVAARHAEGRAAAEHSQSYVWACHLLGYQHPELTAHGSQVRDWYGSEDGLDLHALDHDCAELWTAVTAIEEALRIQRAQIAELAVNWAGSGAAATGEFLQRQCDAANGVVAGVRAAAEGCAALCDNLWQLIDSKVATAMAIDDRTLAQRPAWLAAAETVKARVGSWPAAEEMVNQEVKPYVDNDIRVDWLTVMRSTLASAAASYDALTDRLSTLPATSFQVPGDLGPRRSVPSGEPVQPIGPAVSVPVAPAAAVPPSGGATAVPLPAGPLPFIPEDPFSAPLDPVPTTTSTPSTVPIGGFEDLAATPPISEAGTPFGDASGIPGGSGDLGNLGGVGGLSSLGTLVGRIADAISGLVGSLAEGLADPSGIDDSPFDDPPDADDLLDDDADDRPDDDADDRPDDDADDRPDDDADDRPDEEKADDEQADGSEDVADSQTAQEGTTPPADGPPSASPGEPLAAAAPPPAAPPPAAPPPADPPPAPPDPQPRGSTPCEIAADELPQAGQ
jgi:hypothetical protein